MLANKTGKNMKLLTLLNLVTFTVVFAQRGDMGFIEDGMDDTWNVQGDEWGSDDWRGDTPSWEGETGPIVGGISFGVPIQAAPLIGPFEFGSGFGQYENVGDQFSLGNGNGYIGHLGKYCKVLKGYGSHSLHQDVHQTFGQFSTHGINNNGYYGNTGHIYSNGYQGNNPSYVGSSGNINGQFYQNSFTSGSGFPSVASNGGFQNTAFSSGSVGSIGGVGSSPHLSYTSASSSVSYPSVPSQFSFPSASSSSGGFSSGFRNPSPSFSSSDNSYQ